MKRDRKPTQKQITAIQLINNGMSPRKAMLKAGYSKESAGHPTKRLLQSQGVQTLIDKFHFELKDQGITTAYLAKKYAEWLDATDVVTGAFGPIKDKDTGEVITRPNYRTQLEAGKMLKEIFNITPSKKETEGLKKRVTFEEFVLGESSQPTP